MEQIHVSEKVLFLMQNEETIAEMRHEIGVLARYSRFELLSNSNEDVLSHSEPEIIAVVSDSSSVASFANAISGHSTWLFVGNDISLAQRRQLTQSGYHFVVNHGDVRKTLRRILSKKMGPTQSTSSAANFKRQSDVVRSYAGLLAEFADVYAEFSNKGILVDISPSVKTILDLDPSLLKGRLYTSLGISDSFWHELQFALRESGCFEKSTIIQIRKKQFSCSITACSTLKSRKPGIDFFIVIKSIEPFVEHQSDLMPIANPGLSDNSDTPLIRVCNDVVTGFNPLAEEIMTPLTVGSKWSEIIAARSCFTSHEKVNNDEMNFLIISAQNKSGVKQYFRVIGHSALHEVDNTEYYLLLDTTPFFNHVRNRLQRFFETGEEMKMTISDKIRDDLGALISVGRTILESVMRNSEAHKEAGNEAHTEVKLFQMLERIYRELKIISNEIFPTVIHQFGIEAAVRQLMNGIKSQTDCKFSFEYTPPGKRLDQYAEISVFRIIEDAVRWAVGTRAETLNIECEATEAGIHLLMVAQHAEGSSSVMSDTRRCRHEMEPRIFTFNGKIKISWNKKNTNFDIRIPLLTDKNTANE